MDRPASAFAFDDAAPNTMMISVASMHIMGPYWLRRLESLAWVIIETAVTRAVGVIPSLSRGLMAA